MNDHWKEWLNNKIHLLSTPTGAGVAIVGFALGILLGNMMLSIIKGQLNESKLSIFINIIMSDVHPIRR